VGPEYIAIGLTAVVSAITGGSWLQVKSLEDKTTRSNKLLITSARRNEGLMFWEDDLKRMPLDYVLKVDFLREIQQMHDNFNQINNKLDKLMEKLLESK
jgi:hypothetical protein